MSFNRPAILGIVLGAAIGGIHAALQRRDLREKNKTIQPKGVKTLVPGAVARLAFVVAAWWLAFAFTEADKYWLTGALAVVYTASLLIQLKKLLFPKERE